MLTDKDLITAFVVMLMLGGILGAVIEHHAMREHQYTIHCPKLEKS